jgi:murein DD-endopeptidase MepM/ murein hydrolase activator NlpD
MKKTERIITTILLFVICLSNVATPVAYAAELGKFYYEAHSSSLQDLSSIAPESPVLQPDQGRVLGSSTSLLTIGAPQPDFGSSNGNSAFQQIPIRMEQLAKQVYRTDEDVALSVLNPDNEPFTTTVQDAKGDQISVPVTENSNGTTTTVDLASSNVIRPGRYTVKVTDVDGQSTEQDFTWGVLAMNFDKSMYHPGETGDISMAVLNDNGDMVCDAQVTLQITNKTLGINDTLATGHSGNKQIVVNPQCQQHDYSLQPDYEGHYTFGKTGTYNFQLTATVPSIGSRTIVDSIAVTNEIPFDVQRVSATRLYPPNTYPMLFNITAHRDFTGTITETVPDSFTITPATQSATELGSAVPTSYDDMQTMYLDSNDPAANLAHAIIASDSGGLVMPFQGNYPITQGFGAQMTDPSLQAFYTQYGLAGHDGVDFGVPMDTPLYAVDDGTILWSGPGDYGNTIIIQHGWGESYYGHLSTTGVNVGQRVTKGELIGYSGESGEATGPHLHFGMKPNNPDMTNGYYGKIDPLPYLPFGHEPESVTSLGPTSNFNIGTFVLGDQTSTQAAVTDTPIPTISSTPGVSLTPQPTQTASSAAAPTTEPSAQPTTIPTGVTPTPTPIPSLEQTDTATPAANENFSVLDKEIQLDEQLEASDQTEKVKVITWQVSLKKGEITTLGYDYQAPKVSPQFYLLGPIKFYEKGSNKVVFQEQRQWEIASDDVGVEWYYNANGANTWNGYGWQYRKKIALNSSLVSAAASASGAVTFMESGTDATNDFSMYGSTFTSGSSTITSDSTLSNTGPRSIKATAAGGSGANSDYAVTPAGSLPSTAGRISLYVYFDTTSSNGDFIDLYNNTTWATGLEFTSTNQLSFLSNVGSMVLSTGKWYRISIAYKVTSTSVNDARVYVNGVLDVTSHNNTWVSATVDRFRIGSDLVGGSPTNNETVHFDDIYADSGTDLSDPGDIHVTAKLPVTDAAETYTEVGTPTGDTTCTSGTECEYVNERPLNTSNYVDTTANNSTQSFGIQTQSQGDVNIPTNAGIIANEAWAYVDSSAICTTGNAAIINNGVHTNFTLPTSNTMETNIASSSAYLSGNTAVGIESCATGGPTIKVFEAGTQVAYVPDLINYPVLVSLTSDPDLSAHAQAGGTDILFTDSTGQNLLPFQIDSYSSGSLVAWVQVSSVSTVASSIIYMYFGNPAATSQANASGVWDKNYMGVFHYGTPTVINTADATGLNTSITNNGVTAIAGEFNGGGDYTATNQDLDIGNATGLNPAGTNIYTVELWYKATSLTTDNALYNDGTGPTNGFEVAFDESPCGTTAPYEYKVTRWPTADICVGNVPQNANFHALAIVYNFNGVRAYVDGQISGPTSLDTHDDVSSTKHGFIGDLDGDANQFLGVEDEVRLSNIARSAGWIGTEYNNESSPSTFLTLGSLENSNYAPTLTQVLRHGQFFGTVGSESGNLQPFTW